MVYELGFSICGGKRIQCHDKVAHHTAVARKMALLFLKGVRIGSPMRALATTLPEKMTSIEESHSDSGCFREKASPAAKKNVVCSYLHRRLIITTSNLAFVPNMIQAPCNNPLTHSFRLRKTPLSCCLSLCLSPLQSFFTDFFTCDCSVHDFLSVPLSVYDSLRPSASDLHLPHLSRKKERKRIEGLMQNLF